MVVVNITVVIGELTGDMLTDITMNFFIHIMHYLATIFSVKELPKSTIIL